MATFQRAEPALAIGGFGALDDANNDFLEDANGPQYESIINDQDVAEAILQPAISAAASHLTSQNTPAVEKVAALEKHRGGLLEIPSDGDEDSSPDVDESTTLEPPVDATSTLNIVTDGLPTARPSQGTLPSPWRAGPKQLVIQDAPTRASKGALASAFGPTRNRSRSAGQEALKRLQKAFPSLGSPSHLLSSFPSSFFSNFSDKPNLRNGSPRQNSSSSINRSSRAESTPLPGQGPRRPPMATVQTKGTSPGPGVPTRPPHLRRVTSDDSLLYHTLSRASSLGDDDQFLDVREMVNMRFMALKDSLPDVPNFKMPSLPKMYGQARKSSQSLKTYQSQTSASQPNLVRGASTGPKDPATALDRVLQELEGDIVIMGGYRGSILRSADGPHQQLWAPVKLGLNMRKANLEVGLEDVDEEEMEKSIIPSGMLEHIGPIDISRKFIKKLRSCDNARAGKLRVWNYGYDWRLSPPLLSRKLQGFLEKLPSNQADASSPESRGALVISHSLGGIITRHAVNQRPDLFSGVLYAGVPQRCINILGPIRNGDVVLLNEKLLTAQVNFSMRTSFVFLPEDGFCFVDKTTGESYPIDFYDPQEWVKWALSPCVQPALPAFNRQQPSSLTSFIPNSLRSRADSKMDKVPPSPPATKERTVAPQMDSGTHQKNDSAPPDPERERYFAYLTRTLAMIREFRSELAHDPAHQEANAYPPLAVMYGKTIPTVYAAQVNGREAIPCADAYDDLLFRAGDGVVLAKEAMLPEGYSIVRGGRVCTERGHITMLGDLPAVGQALEALLRGRRKGIGMGRRDDATTGTGGERWTRSENCAVSSVEPRTNVVR